MIYTYEKAVELLCSQGKFCINLGLDRIKKVLDLLGNPQDKIKIIHIAGTNGKGSVSAILANILKYAGYKTALYTSPHLVDYTERIRINNIQISKNDFAIYLTKICDVAQRHNIDLTEFEILTAMAFYYFYENNVDIAIMETGLGGRFDAVNVCKKPLLSVITSISLDHTDRLGNTIEQIAFEKGGIIKQSVPVVIASDNMGYKVIKTIAEEKQSSIFSKRLELELDYINNQNYVVYNGKSYEFSLIGLYQKKNIELVFNSVQVLKNIGYKIENYAVKEGLKTVKWPARLEFIRNKNILIDGAHNPDAALELKKSLDFYFKNQKRIFIYSTLNTKNYSEISNILFDKNDEIFYFEFNYKNAVKFDEYVANTSKTLNIKKLSSNDLSKIINKKELKIVTGSLYMIGQIYNQLH